MMIENAKSLIKDNFSQVPWLYDNTLFLTKHGSHAYGLNTQDSDLDLKGFCVPPKEYFYGFLNNFEQAESHHPNDAVIFDLKKFIKLAADANPSVLEVIFTDESDHLITTSQSDLILSHRDNFLSKKVKYTFQGYAFSQVKRINLHRRWLLYPVKDEPTRKSFGLPDHTLIPKDQLAAAKSSIEQKMKEWDLNFLDDLDEASKISFKEKFQNILLDVKTSEELWITAAKSLNYSDNFIWLLQKEKEYESKRRDYENYIKWKKERNPKRAALEEKHGYDCKFALHIARLSLMCGEILETGKVIVKRKDDKDFLMSIRNGNMTYEELIEWFEKQNAIIDQRYQTSKLPHSPDKVKLDNLCISIVENILK